MKKIDYETMKKNIVEVLKNCKGPIWISDLHTKFNLPWCSLNSKRKCNANKALHDLIKGNEIVALRGRYYKKSSNKPRVKIGMPPSNRIAKQARTYFEVQLVDRIEILERQMKNLKRN